MPLSTTVVGSFPKPSYLNIPDWFNPACTKDFSEKYTLFLQSSSNSKTEELISRAIKETAQLQAEAGLDVISDGEMRRENYVYHFCRKLKGFDFQNFCPRFIRSDAASILVPRVVGKVSLQENEPCIWSEWKNSQDLFKELPMKITIPGPMTIADTVMDQYYHNDKVLGGVLSQIINKEITAVVAAGCKFIQVRGKLAGLCSSGIRLPLALNFVFGRPVNISFCAKPMCWALWISRVQRFFVPSYFS